ncbi:oxidoreductase [Avibacterium sp. 20-15]|uniref:oxidoreductase n=1 Tax=unclassified Avibacterium TaxID=2685287 RepID=UPI002026FE3E|nr:MULTISPECIES: oxidoreductase [unclassified Avibacterium]MCW9733829.1 oxidoreductase [Avibacterium sp. 20-15]URL04012.1 oxidoreductase [Avibacterium sp. 20-132]
MLKIAIAAEFELAEKLAECLEQSQLEIDHLSVVEIFPFNEEQGIRFNNKAVEQIVPDEVDWTTFNYVLFAGEVSAASHLAKAADAGCVVMDLFGICASLPDVPLVLPTVNDQQVMELRQRNIVALPNPQVTQSLLPLADLLQQYPLKQVLITSLLPASYMGDEKVAQLAGQTARLLNGIPLEEQAQRLAFDVFPVQRANLSAQVQKIFPQLDNVIFHQVQVPVFYGLAQQVSAFFDYDVEPERVVQSWQQNALLSYHPDTLITPVINGENENGESEVKLHISNLKQQQSAVENGIEFWSVADEQRFNLALMAVKLTELVYQAGY